MINFPELTEEEFDENNLIETSFLEKATKYLEDKGITEIAVNNRYNSQNAKKGTTPLNYTIKKFFVKLCNAAGLYNAIDSEELKNDFGFALLCVEQQPLSYLDLPHNLQIEEEIIRECKSHLIDHDVKNNLKTDYVNFSQEEKSALLKLQFALRYDGEAFVKYQIKNETVIKELLKINPNIYRHIGSEMQMQPDVVEFVKNIPLKYGIASLGRMFGKKTDNGYIIPQKFKDMYANLFEEQQYYYIHGIYR